jgi:LPXTG-site transpeptidase (sortase) family protein
MKPIIIKGLMVFSGVLFLGLAVGVGWSGYQRLHSPLDAVAIPASNIPGVVPGGSTVIPPDLPLPSHSLNGLISVPPDEGVASVNPPEISSDYAFSNPSSGAAVFYQGFIPDRIRIPAISLDAPIVPTMYQQITYTGRKYYQWLVPYGTVAGWQDTSALLGVPGNTVLNGHNNGFGEVFKNLANLNVGDLIQVSAGNRSFFFKVAARMILPERFEDISVRLQNAQWLMPSSDERLTLLTCWPSDDSTYRLIVVAFPDLQSPATDIRPVPAISQ